ncbi:MAG: TonB-dependent receptor, partial [Gallionella sp.]|nr:TonB-dependent receptor [Gallionella sp.]
GISPVSVGGDSIGGTVQVDSAAPQFAQAGAGTLVKGEAGAFYRSNNAAQGGHLNATIAGEDVSVRYTGSTVRAKNYTAGSNFKNPGVSVGTIGNIYVAGNEVASSQYQSDNQSLVFGMRRDNHLFELKLGQQHIPYQGFPNQRMDMLKNDSQQINLNYTGQYGWGVLHARAYNEHTRHYMNFLEAKTVAMMPPGMPMDTSGQNSGLVVKGDVVLNERDILRVGAEYQRYRMSDWWRPVAAAGMMGGGTFLNINNGQRDRLGVFGEWEARWNPQWESQLGLRYESVKMDTGPVQGYNTIAYPAATYAAFNAASRARNDSNIDLTALARYTPDERKTFEIGFAQKTRSPNLYERFAWSTNNTMVMSMNTWFGDGNGYVGNLNLKPEVARTVSGSFSLHDADVNGFEVKVAPYYTHVQNYIDAVSCASVGKVCPAPAAGFLNLSLANQTARLYGADVTARVPLAQGGSYGDFVFTGVLNYVNGKNLTTGDNLYHIMPLNAKLAVEQRWGDWTNTVEAKLVSAHTSVQTARNERQSGGYSLLNLRSSYEWKQMRFDIGVENLLNKFYVDPLGGSYLGQRPMVAGIGVPGMGRSINAGVTVKF